MKHIGNKILDLIIAYHRGHCTDAQKRQLNEWVLSDAANERAFRHYIALLIDLELTGNMLSHGEIRPLVKRRMHRGGNRMRIAGIAAAAAVITGVVMLLLTGREKEYGEFEPVAKNITVELSDGREVVIDRTLDGTLMADGDAVIVKRDGMLVFDIQPGDTTVTEELRWVTLKVPAGEMIDFMLADGSHVWVNANSNLRFPARFGCGDRRVFMDGEAYFDVEPQDGKPFIVETARQSIKVLGTEFNVCAYAGEVEQTTLVEGSVEVVAGENAVTLLPGQGAFLGEGSKDCRVGMVDTHSVTAWQQGMFAFDGKTLGEVFWQLAHWYGIEYEFEDTEAERLVVRGNLRQQKDIGVIFNAIEMSGLVEITMKGFQVKIETKGS